MGERLDACWSDPHADRPMLPMVHDPTWYLPTLISICLKNTAHLDLGLQVEDLLRLAGHLHAPRVAVLMLAYPFVQVSIT